ncbi:MAG: VCBS domain-containing protein, partial [Pseudomonadales bacterium]
FSGTPLNADVGTISVEVTADDGNGGTPATDTFDIVVSNTPDAPLIGGIDTGSVTEDVDPDTDGLLEVANALTIADPDVGESSFVAGTINGTYGDLVIDAAGNWSYSADNTQAAIQSLDVTEFITDTLTVTTADGTTHDIVITINGAEDASVQGGTSTGTVTEDGGAIGNSLTITDVDTNDNPVSYNDVAATAGSNGYGDFAISGNAWTYTLNNALAAIQSLDTGDTLSDSFTFSATDGSTQLVTVTINGAEDAPTASDNTLSMIQGNTLTLNTADFGFADVDTGDTLASVRITALASAGDLQLAGTSVALNQVITRTDIDAGQLAFVPAPSGSGVGYASFAFSVNDGALNSTASNTIDIDVTPLPEPEEPEQPPEEPEEPTVDRVTEPEPEPTPEPAPETDPGEVPVIAPVVDDGINKPGIELPQPISGEAAVELALFDDDDRDGISSLLPKHVDLHNLSLSAIDIEHLQLLEYQSLFDNDDFVRALDDLGVTFDRAAAEEQAEYSLGAETRLGIAVSLSAGFVSWALRAGSLLASVFSVMPLWKQLDPLPIVGTKDEDEEDVSASSEHEQEAALEETTGPNDPENREKRNERKIEDLFNGGNSH